MAARLPNNLGSARSTDPSRVGFLPGGRDTGAGPVVCGLNDTLIAGFAAVGPTVDRNNQAILQAFQRCSARMRASLLRGEPTGSGGTPGVGGLPTLCRPDAG